MDRLARSVGKEHPGLGSRLLWRVGNLMVAAGQRLQERYHPKSWDTKTCDRAVG
jgi:hypothetical protein